MHREDSMRKIYGTIYKAVRSKANIIINLQMCVEGMKSFMPFQWLSLVSSLPLLAVLGHIQLSMLGEKHTFL